MMEPPADRLYAVLPVGVLMISPSAMAYVRCRDDTEMEMWARCGAAPRWRMISLRAWVGEAGGAMRSPVEEYSATFKRLRRRTRAEREMPVLLLREVDLTRLPRAESWGSVEDDVEALGLGRSARVSERKPALSLDM